MYLGLGFSAVSVFLFKQKTAYEMRISDWISDVCSSDLPQCLALLDRRVSPLDRLHEAIAERGEVASKGEDDEDSQEDEDPGGEHLEALPDRNPTHHQGAGYQHQHAQKINKISGLVAVVHNSTSRPS